VLQQLKTQQCHYSSNRAMKDPRFFTLYQHAKSRFLDEQRKSGVLSHKMEINRVRLHFEMTGDGAHNVILLPGALGSSRTDFSYQMNHFNKRDFTLIAIDPRGYGQSIPPERDWPLEFLQRDAEDAVELVQKLGLEKISVLGWSDGGIVGLIMAARYPDLVKNLVVWGANAYITRKDMEYFQGIRDVANWSEEMRVPYMAMYGEKYFREQWQSWVDAFQSYYDKRGGDICVSDLEQIKARTLIIHGLKDRMVALEHPDYLHHSIKGSRLYIMPEGKHNVHMKYHREFNFLAEHFLREKIDMSSKHVNFI